MYTDVVIAKALKWWRLKCIQVLEKPNKCYSGLYFLISDIPALITYLVVAGLAAACIYLIWTGGLEDGFYISKTDYSQTMLILTFVLPFFLGLLNGYWYQIDIWYRELQPYMGLRQPSCATENLLLGYPGDLPVVVTIRALSNQHWRLALTSIMPLVQRLLPILSNSIFTIDTTSSPDRFQINIVALPFKIVTGMLCAYLVLIPVVWPGPSRRLPMIPVCIANAIVYFYDSTLVRKDAFLPARLDEQRWHMKYRLCLEERLYGFGIYTGRYGALHIGIDDVYGYPGDEIGFRFVAPLKPPMRRYRRWLRGMIKWSAKKLSIKRQPTFHEEELQALQRLHTTLQDQTQAQEAAGEDTRSVSEADRASMSAGTIGGRV